MEGCHSRHAGVLLIPFAMIVTAASAQQLSISELIDGLHAESAKARISACRSLASLGPNAFPAVDALVPLIEDERCVAPSWFGDQRPDCVREHALIALGAIGPAAEAALPQIRRLAISTQDPPQTALTAMARIEGVHCLVPVLSGDSAAARVAAALALADAQSQGAGLSSPGPPLLQPLVAMLHSSRSERDAAIRALAALGPAAAPAAHQLIGTIANYPDDQVVKALVAMGDAVLGEVRPLLNSRRWALRTTARGVLKELDSAAIDPIGELPAIPQEAVACLNRLLSDDARPDNNYLRAQAGRRLAEYGPAAAPAIPGLLQLMADSDPHWAYDASRTLAAIGELAVPSLLEMAVKLREGTPSHGREEQWAPSAATYRGRVLTTLGRIGPTAAAALPELLLSSRDADKEVRTAAASALGYIRLADAAPFDRLVGMVESDPDAAVRRHALGALAELATVVPEVCPYLSRIALSGDPLGKGVPFLLSDIGSPALPFLLGMLDSTDAKLRANACLAVSRMKADPLGERMVQIAIRLTVDPDANVAGCARAIVYKCVATHPATIMDALLLGEPDISQAVRSVLEERGVPPTLREEAERRGPGAVTILEEIERRNAMRPVVIM